MQRSLSNSTRSSSTVSLPDGNEPDYDDPETSWDDIRKLGLEEVKARLKRGTMCIHYMFMSLYVLIVGQTQYVMILIRFGEKDGSMLR